MVTLICNSIYLYNVLYQCMIDMYTRYGYNMNRIRSFKDKETERVYNQLFSKRIYLSIQRTALRKLIMIDNSETLEDLRNPPSNHLEKLQGDREGWYSVRINDQYRICFIFEKGFFYDVEIVDYH